MSKYSNRWFNLAAIALAAIVAGCGGGEQAAADAAADASIRRALATGGSSTGVDTIYSEAGKLVRAEETVESLGNDLFGDKVSLYNGALEFQQTDVSLPGNSAIPVAVSRRLTTGTTMAVGGNFGDWDLEIPHIHGVFATTRGWTVGAAAPGYEGQRCSQYGAPPQVLGQNNQGTFDPEEYWHGSFLYVPGQGSKELLKRNAAVQVPADGNSYPLTTASQWVIRCLPTLASGGAGEGFVAVAPDGTQYFFDRMITRPTSVLVKANPAPISVAAARRNALAVGTRQVAATASSAGSGAGTGSGSTIAPPPENLFAGYLLQRSEVWIVPSKVIDRYGNRVDYTYDSSAPWHVTKIADNSSSTANPRVLNLSYFSGTNRISTVADGGGRTWTYGYRLAAGNVSVLSTVTRPDTTRWTFNLDALTMTSGLSTGGGSCDGDMSLDTSPKTGTITHPSGATGSFVVAGTQHGRSGVERVCRGNLTDGDWSLFPLFIDAFSIQSKTLSGPGMAPATWAYSYGPANASFAPCNGCVQTKTVTVTDPRSVATRYTFGNLYRVTEGQLLRTDEGIVNGSAPLRVTTQAYRSPTAGPYPDPIGTSPQPRTVNDLATRYAPQNYKNIYQQAVNFTWQASAFDAWARPTTVTRSSGLGDTRTENIAYDNNLTKYVVGQVTTVTVGSLVASENKYDTSARRYETWAFGLRTNEYSYNGDGTLATKKDAGAHITTFGAYKYGLPQSVTHPDGAFESVEVNDIGRVSSHTNAVNTKTLYGYDLIGRLNSITQPGGDPVTWNPTILTMVQVNSAENGLAAGHWRQTITTGNATTVRLFDALWRERMTRTYDAANPAGTRSVIERRFDGTGNKVFESYPLRDIAAVDGAISYTGAGGVTGKTTSYEPLGRVFQTIQSSELGALTTTHSYLNGFLHQTSNPRGKVSTSSFQAFDAPSEDAIRSVTAPEGVNLAISRDVFGKPKAINRNGSYGGGTSSATRSYVYDVNQRLCKTVEPESGATVQAYDSANNLAWRASGLSLPSTGSCDQTSAPSARKVSFGYDLRNRLTSTNYGDGSPIITRNYTLDGLPNQVISAGSTWTYSYFNRRILKQESLAYGGSTYAFDLGRDANGNVATQGYPGASVGYAPNALGQPTQLGAYASGVTYHPNGAMAGYTLANGVVHSVTQNTRGLPLVWRDAGVIQDQYTYDQNGNVTGITDQQEAGATSRSMGYDGLDRLTTANSPGIWGTGTFVYDPLDNVRVSTVGARTLTHNYDSTNRMTGVSGSINMTLGYDLNGNLNMRGPQAFNFDIGNRMTSATGKATYVYDGLGRRIKVNYTDGTSKLQIYSQAGKLLYSSHSTQGVTYHGYLGSQLIVEYNTITGNSFAHTDALGSPVARTGQTLGTPTRTRYEPYGATAGGTVPTGIGYTGHVNDSDTGLVYMQQRYYEPYAARFLSVDPVTTDANTGDSFNRYVYAKDSPYRYVDPDGGTPIALGRLVAAGSFRLASNLGAAAVGSWLGIKVYDVLHQGASDTTPSGNGSKESDDAVRGLTGGLPSETKDGKPTKGQYISGDGDAEADLDALPGTVGANGEKTLPDGSSAGIHTSTTTGSTTLHINRPKGKQNVKIRYPAKKTQDTPKKEEEKKQEQPKVDPT